MWDKVHSNVGRRADKSAAGTAMRHRMQLGAGKAVFGWCWQRLLRGA